MRRAEGESSNVAVVRPQVAISGSDRQEETGVCITIVDTVKVIKLREMT
jgi:hypothetical protein